MVSYCDGFYGASCRPDDDAELVECVCIHATANDERRTLYAALAAPSRLVGS